MDNFVGRCTIAILSLRDQVICWPDSTEQAAIRSAFENAFGSLGCVGIMEGTLVPLALKPTTYGEDYYTRKSNHAISTLLVCDDIRRFRYVSSGWPGSAHDQRVYSNSRLAAIVDSWIDSNGYIVADSAYTAHTCIVPAFKRPPGKQLNSSKERFNFRLLRMRVVIEHSSGILISRFQCPKGLRILIDSAESLKKAVDLIECCVILHNMCITEDIPAAWLVRDTDAVDAAESLGGRSRTE